MEPIRSDQLQQRVSAMLEEVCKGNEDFVLDLHIWRTAGVVQAATKLWQPDATSEGLVRRTVDLNLGPSDTPSPTKDK